MGSDGGGRGGAAAPAVARVHRLRCDGIRFHRTAGLPGTARVRLRAASVRGTGGLAGPSPHRRTVSGLCTRQGRACVAREAASAVPAERSTPDRRRPRYHRAPGRTRSAPRSAAAAADFARGLRAARRGEGALIGRSAGRGPPRRRQPVKSRPATIRIAAGQGFWGDWLEAPYRQVTGGPVDYLMMDYLAEVTMSILQKQKARDPSLGYAKDFIPLMERILPIVAERRIKITANAGGVNPRGCAQAVAEIARHLRLTGKLRIGVVTGDDLLGRLDGLLARGHELRNLDTNRRLADVRDRVVSANAYLGAWPVVDALRRGRHRDGTRHRHRAHPRTHDTRLRVAARRLGPPGRRHRRRSYDRMRRPMQRRQLPGGLGTDPGPRECRLPDRGGGAGWDVRDHQASRYGRADQCGGRDGAAGL